MRIRLLLFCVVLFGNAVNAQQIGYTDFVLYENLPDWVKAYNGPKEIEVSLSGKMNPFYLEADFNGQGELDIAISIHVDASLKRGILIIHKEDNKAFIIGGGSNLGSGGDDWSWLDVWTVYRKKTATETLFTKDFDIAGSKEVILKNIAIKVAASEGAGNLIMWDGQKYVWIHTGS